MGNKRWIFALQTAALMASVLCTIPLFGNAQCSGDLAPLSHRYRLT